jgi:hypothetical protein
VLINRLSHLVDGLSIGKIGGKIGSQCRLIPFDCQEDVSALGPHPSNKCHLRVQRISSHDAPPPAEQGQQRLRNRNFIRLCPNPHLDQHLLGRMGVDAQEVRGSLHCRGCTPQRLAIQCNGFALPWWAGGAHPSSQRPLQIVDRQAWQQPSVEGSRRSQMMQWPENTSQEFLLLATPLLEGLRGIAVTQQRCHQAGQKKWQRIAAASAVAWVWEVRKDGSQACQTVVCQQVVPFRL